ncbi:MAG TPA: hypothetical protein VIW01_03385, partial [Dehalococcoidia bacterium]
MAWLTSLLGKQVTVDEELQPSAQDLPSADREPTPPPPTQSGPPLAILAPDIGGISSFRLRFFADAATAAADIEQLPPEMRRATHAFWALHDEPVLPPEGHREALVLIRANHTSDVVYAVSFVDLKSAWSFARFEAKRGLDLSHLIILWAAFATVREEMEGVTVLPESAPATRSQHVRIYPQETTVELEATETVREYERREEPAISDSVAAPEAPEAPSEPDNEARVAAADAERRAEAARRAEAEEAARIARQAQERLQAAREAADAARAQAEAEATRRHEAERRLEERQRAADAAARSSALADMESRIDGTSTVPEATPEEPIIPDATSVALDGLAEARTQTVLEVRLNAPEAPEEATREVSAEEVPDGGLGDEDEPVARGTVFAHSAIVQTADETTTVEIPEHLSADGDGDPTNDLPKVPQLDDFDIAYEVARL